MKRRKEPAKEFPTPPSKAPVAARAAMAFLRHEPDAALRAGLRFLGRKWDADRAWLARYDAPCHRLWISHRWTRTGTSSFIQEVEAMPVTRIGWLHERMIEAEPVMVADVERLPRAARSLRSHLLHQSLKSNLFVPVFHRRKLVGQIGFSAERRGHEWSLEKRGPLAALETLGELYFTALRRHEEAGQPLVHPVREGAVFLSEGHAKRGVDPERIVSIGSEGDYSIVRLDDGTRHRELRSLAQWTAVLPSALFARVERSLIVRVSRVETVERKRHWRLRLVGSRAWHVVGRRFRPGLEAKLRALQSPARKAGPR